MFQKYQNARRIMHKFKFMIDMYNVRRLFMIKGFYNQFHRQCGERFIIKIVKYNL
ncbi:hypothetical protein pb186bvf_001626 [Paramecium bursaria]